MARVLLAAVMLWPSSGLTADAPPKLAEMINSGSDSAETGRRLLRVFKPREYWGDPVNFSVAQAGNGLIYAANMRMGVLEYDGLRWRTISPGLRKGVTAVAVDADSGRVYVGAYGDFGYLAPDDHGALRFVSLLTSVPESQRGFAEVWRVIPTPQGVLFVTAGQIFSYDGRTIDVLSTAAVRYPVVAISGRVFALEQGRGLVERRNGAWQGLPGGEVFAGDKLAALLPFPGGDDDDWLVVTRQRGLFRLVGGVARPWRTALDDVKQDVRQGEVLALPDGRLAFGTRGDGVFLMDATGRSLERIGSADGLPEGVVYGMSTDREGGLWLAMDRGLVRLDLGGALTRFNTDDGLRGRVRVFARFEGAMFAGSSNGLFRLRAGPERGFERIAGMDSAHALLALPDSLLVAGGDGVYEWRNQTLQRVIPVVSGYLLADRTLSSRVYLSTAAGVEVWEKSGTTWRNASIVANVINPGALWQDTDGAIWVAQSRSAPARITLSADGQAEVARFENAPDAAGLPFHLWPLQGELRAANGNGLYRLDADAGRFVLDPDFSGMFVPGQYEFAGHAEVPGRGLMIARAFGNLFDVQLGWAIRKGAGPYAWQDWPVTLPPDFILESVHADADGTVWLGGEEGALRIDTQSPVVAKQGQVLLREVRAGDGALLFGGAGSPPRIELPYRGNRLRFGFATAHYGNAQSVRYRAELQGSDNVDANWSEEAFRDYSNLREGEYRFQVRAVFADGSEARPADFTFVVQPPWFRSSWAYGGYAVLALLLVWAVVQWRTRTLMARQRTLRMRLILLQSQLEPHFLFNALNAIGALVRSAQITAALHSISGLSGLLRYALVASRQSWTTIDEEVKFITDYLDLQMLRFEDRLRYELQVDESVRDVACPALLLQPLVENAICHGIEPLVESGCVSVSATAEPRGVRVQVSNPVGSSPTAPGHGIGLSSVRERLELIYRGRAEFFAGRKDDRFVVSFLLRDDVDAGAFSQAWWQIGGRRHE